MICLIKWKEGNMEFRVMQVLIPVTIGGWFLGFIEYEYCEMILNEQIILMEVN